MRDCAKNRLENEIKIHDNQIATQPWRLRFGSNDKTVTINREKTKEDTYDVTVLWNESIEGVLVAFLLDVEIFDVIHRHSMSSIGSGVSRAIMAYSFCIVCDQIVN